jgi:hypothetical protein
MDEALQCLRRKDVTISDGNPKLPLPTPLKTQGLQLGKLADPYFSELQRCIMAGR